jgi:hypothetical protein
MKGDDLKEFNKLTGTSQKQKAAPAKKSSGTSTAKSGHMSKQSGTKQVKKEHQDLATKDKTMEDFRPQTKPNEESTGSTMMEDFHQATKNINSGWAKYRSAKVGTMVPVLDAAGNPAIGKDGKPEMRKLETKDDVAAYKKEIMLEIQAAKQDQLELNQFMTNFLKKQHEMAMAIIRNI